MDSEFVGDIFRLERKIEGQSDPELAGDGDRSDQSDIGMETTEIDRWLFRCIAGFLNATLCVWLHEHGFVSDLVYLRCQICNCFVCVMLVCQNCVSGRDVLDWSCAERDAACDFLQRRAQSPGAQAGGSSLQPLVMTSLQILRHPMVLVTVPRKVHTRVWAEEQTACKWSAVSCCAVVC